MSQQLKCELINAVTLEYFLYFCACWHISATKMLLIWSYFVAILLDGWQCKPA